MATYQSQQVSDRMPIPSHGYGGSVYCQRFPLTITAALTTADVLQFGYLPKYARVVDALLEASDMDTNGSPTLAFNIGDAGDVDRLFAASTAGQAAGITRMTLATGFGYRYDDETLITGAPSTNAATGAAGTLALYVWFVIEDDGVGYPD
ncbi:MAG: hypothetical protein V4696_09525 [Pseudomonadota bacterium]